MSVVDTRSWLTLFIRECKKDSSRGLFELQSDILCRQLEQYFPEVHPDEFLYHLHQNGLFQPREWRKIESVVRDMEKQKLWKIVQNEFQQLKERWQGPDIPVFIFPIKNANIAQEHRYMKKNGLALKNGIFLFVSSDHPKPELKAILAHEYHHVCRLSFLDLDDQNLSLKELLVLEGLAEYAVQDLYGEKWMAPWTSLYSYDEAERFWRSDFVSSLNTIDNEKRFIYMYGKKLSRFPKWIGYNIGFQIVDSYVKHQGPLKHHELFQKSADEIIRGSSFNLKK